MGRIFCIMGKSATGKDTIYKKLLEEESLKLKTIVPYTTRPIRFGETDGVQYYFCDEKKVNMLKEQGKIIELRAYNTACGVWKYFTVDDGQVQLAQSNYLVIGTLVSFEKMKSYFGEENVIPIYIEVEDGVRLSRALERERAQKIPKYEELCRRFLADAKDFSEENLLAAGIQKRFVNQNLTETQKEIENEIKCFTRTLEEE